MKSQFLAAVARAPIGDPLRSDVLFGPVINQAAADQQHALDEWQKRVDARVRTAIGNVSPFSGLHKDVRALADRIAELEAKLQAIADAESSER